MGELLRKRRAETAVRIKKLKQNLKVAEKICGVSACVYATGSFARGEASSNSDLDLFIVGKVEKGIRIPSRLNEILIKADLIYATRKLGIPDFSGDGQYLAHYTVQDLVDTLGKPDDDVSNTFTARLLLLLESSPLVGKPMYERTIRTVIDKYWGDYKGHEKNFKPAFLANDIIRMWRTFCVNYEARTKKIPLKERAKRRLKNYKLKHSRLLTCYSALLHLLTIYGKNKTVTPDDAIEMISMTPVKRLEWLLTQPQLISARVQINKLIVQYEEFLK